MPASLRSLWWPLSVITLDCPRTSLVAQWLRLCAPNAGGLGLNPGQGTRTHAEKKTPCSQINTKRKNIRLSLSDFHVVRAKFIWLVPLLIKSQGCPFFLFLVDFIKLHVWITFRSSFIDPLLMTYHTSQRLLEVTQLCPNLCDPMDWNSLVKNTGVGSLSLLQGFSFPTQELNWGLAGRLFTNWAIREAQILRLLKTFLI